MYYGQASSPPMVMTAHWHPADTLRRLDDDILYTIFGMLRPRQNLRPLSLTCKWIRFACSPVLFRECFVLSWTVDASSGPQFVPRALWPYICAFHFTGSFNRSELPWVTEDDGYPLDPLLDQGCIRRRVASVKLGDTIREALYSMALLCTVSIIIPCGAYATGKPGVSPYVLEAIWSTPQLRHFVINGPLCHPEDPIPSGVTFSSVARLSTFCYLLNLYRSPSKVTQTEKEVVLRVLLHTHDTLEVLVCPSECFPSVDVMGLWQWPMLHELIIRGERVATPPPLIHILSKMPRLRVLYLQLAEPAHAAAPLIWPPSLDLQCEWRELERLAVAHPHPDDNLYSNLPDTLLDLALRCWPRNYKHHAHYNANQLEAGVRWSSPLLSSTEMLCILRKIHAPRLTFLELEFRADSYDDQLFRHIGCAFPALTGLIVHRYRAPDEDVAPLAAIADGLSALRRLEVLMLHLDFAGLPNANLFERSSWRSRFLKPRTRKQLAEIDTTFTHAANVFAGLLGPALSYICFLRPLFYGSRHQWIPFRIVRSAEDGVSVEKCRINASDTFQLPHSQRFSIYEDD
ncbi:hypothetical protein PYCCODRAFT_1381171 [Trametes coccinea BRFM310]|uniref:F-box domain-containing protein n=1 Tax=Trametes coccinea (strain BRFM310) TaxID=1353009 RepID=A0A1Y2J6U2_TRAC3|nr:hypothetical protein PYCCODRAFT_1381171 [Trametes coccinea BRFM310]